MCNRITKCYFADVTKGEIYEMQYYMGLLIGLETQIGQLLFNRSSSGFPNVTVYASWHVSSLRCCSGVLPLHLSHRAAWVVGRSSSVGQHLSFDPVVFR